MARPEKAAAKAASNKPVFRFSDRGITVSVFRNVTKDGGAFYKVQTRKTYRDKDGEFQDTTSFSSDELPLKCELERMAYQAVVEARAEDDNAPDEE